MTRKAPPVPTCPKCKAPLRKHCDHKGARCPWMRCAGCLGYGYADGRLWYSAPKVR